MAAININWGALNGAGNAGGGVMDAFRQGQELGRERTREDILARYAANPTQDALAPLAAVDPRTYAALSQNERERAEVSRQANARRLGGAFLRQQDGTPNALAGTIPSAVPAGSVVPSSAAVGGAPVPGNPGVTTAANGDIMVTAPVTAAPEGPKLSIADIFQEDPKLANELADFMGKMDDTERKDFSHRMGAGAAVAMAAQSLPYEKRGSFIDENTPLLKQAGWTADQIADFDPTDDNIQGLAALGVGADKYMADRRQAEGQRITIRGQDVSATTSRRGQDISAATARRGQDISAATARSGQAVTMRGQDLAAARAGAKPAQIQKAREKLTDLRAIENQLNRAEAALKKTGSKGAWAGLIPGKFDSSASAADTAIDQLAPLIRKLTRTPGEGAMSDYESRLAQAGLPSRSMTDEARAEAFAGLRDLIRGTREGYSGYAEAPAVDTSGWKITRVTKGK